MPIVSREHYSVVAAPQRAICTVAVYWAADWTDGRDGGLPVLGEGVRPTASRGLSAPTVCHASEACAVFSIYVVRCYGAKGMKKRHVQWTSAMCSAICKSYGLVTLP